MFNCCRYQVKNDACIFLLRFKIHPVCIVAILVTNPSRYVEQNTLHKSEKGFILYALNTYIMKSAFKIIAASVLVLAMSCTSGSDKDKKYIEDTLVHKAGSPIIKDRSMVPGPDTTDRNLDDPNTKKPD